MTHFLVYWRKPTEGFIALNTHGALQSGIAAGGGVLRNHFGDHISNFYNNYGKVSIHFAQSKAILDGLTICKELGYNKIQIQTDSAEAALWFHRHLTVTVPLDRSSFHGAEWEFKHQDTMSLQIFVRADCSFRKICRHLASHMYRREEEVIKNKFFSYDLLEI